MTALQLATSTATSSNDNAIQAPAAPTRLDRATRDALIKENLGLVHRIARDISQHGAPLIPMEDLVGYGSIGLVEAAERFDASGNLPFSHFARYRIRGAIFDGVRYQGASHNGLTYRRVGLEHLAAEARANRLLEQEAVAHFGEIDSPERALAYVDQVLTKLARIHALSSVAVDDEADLLDRDGGAGNRWNGTTLVTEQDPVLDQICVHRALAVLTPKQRKVVELIYGQDKDQYEVARELGIKSGTVTKLHQRALAALRGAIAPEEAR